MLNNKLTKSQRELFCNLKAFLYTKAKNFTPIQLELSKSSALSWEFE